MEVPVCEKHGIPKNRVVRSERGKGWRWVCRGCERVRELRYATSARGQLTKDRNNLRRLYANPRRREWQ